MVLGMFGFFRPISISTDGFGLAELILSTLLDLIFYCSLNQALSSDFLQLVISWLELYISGNACDELHMLWTSLPLAV